MWMWAVRCRQLARGPSQAAAAQDVDVQVVDGLASIRSIVDHNPVAISQTCSFGYFLGRHHQVAQQLVEKEHRLIKMWNAFNLWVLMFRNKCQTQTGAPNLASSVITLGLQGNMMFVLERISDSTSEGHSLKDFIALFFFYLKFKCIISLWKKIIFNQMAAKKTQIISFISLKK